MLIIVQDLLCFFSKVKIHYACFSSSMHSACTHFKFLYCNGYIIIAREESKRNKHGFILPPCLVFTTVIFGQVNYIEGRQFTLNQSCKGPYTSGIHNSSYLVVWISTFFTMAPNICGQSLLHVTFMAPKILRWLLNFSKIWCIPDTHCSISFPYFILGLKWKKRLCESG